jgi:hypothetical protein
MFAHNQCSRQSVAQPLIGEHGVLRWLDAGLVRAGPVEPTKVNRRSWIAGEERGLTRVAIHCF